ncbi:hypothetical protein [Croceivirga thetidis]|uniref:Cellobiose phosphorylase n=1 Tax=Croceivirga thetidis TaxID=2721623 RepID=A0ABX1GSX6_9FLAO|nr:hypothetical protein [Croceivirga thetidis]NKI33062.1 hypothetical protein [Croceivirga thetidis]
MSQIKNLEDNQLEHVTIDGELYFKIRNHDSMRPFFMSIVSDSNHWMFISSNGGLTAGRKNSEYALFPYYTDDKITESVETTGSKTIIRIQKQNSTAIWEPFSDKGDTAYRIARNLYKNSYGNKIIFEEVNLDLKLTFKYQWANSNLYGFVRSVDLINNGDLEVNVSVLDGIQNVLPYGVGSYTQTNSSNLVDAYKRTELLEESGLGIFALSAIIVDKAEPSEALKANVVWSLGFSSPKHLLSSLQVDDFRKGESVLQETDIKAEKGAYFVQDDFHLSADQKKNWKIIANVSHDHTAVFGLDSAIKNDPNLDTKLLNDINLGTDNLIALCAASDGLQKTKDVQRNTRHFSNTLFNIMRGGIFDHGYVLEKWDIEKYFKNANKTLFEKVRKELNGLPETFNRKTIEELANQIGDSNFTRLCKEYLPLKFSRRHGDPSRPWNRFSINTRSEKDGSKILDYEGNWRDIFQNWEALAISYPQFIESMIHKFLNASTFDGYNPYRVTKGGFDWEIIEPDDPWSYIGYWGDHQIIYLLKFLEFYEDTAPGELQKLFTKDVFVYANVPYRIKDYDDILKNPKDTIEFDEDLDKEIRKTRNEVGADGALLRNKEGEIITVNFVEKLLATALAKVSNFIPEAGIWMNTQRPEWNDANNALVGNGVSMATLYYLRRFLSFFSAVFEKSEASEFQVANELADLFKEINATFEAEKFILEGKVDNTARKRVADGLGNAAGTFRTKIYKNHFSGKKENISKKELLNFLHLSLNYLEHSIEANKRSDNMYHAYNLMTVENEKEISVSHLDEMLEGQVAVLSSKYLCPEAALEVLDGLKQSKLFRADQYSYLLYPNKDLPLFAQKNRISEEDVDKSELLKQLIAEGNFDLISKSVKGTYHFNGNFRNANDVQNALDELRETKYSNLVDSEEEAILNIFESVFNHKSFTGRSGTFYGYEGLGSIYWHMVSKLLLAVQECCLNAIESEASDEVIGRLLEHYYEINEGIGVHKTPKLYGAFPTDPYSHTPGGKGAQQPGMTGQVKEDILSRFGELGVRLKNGKVCFAFGLLRKSEFLSTPSVFQFRDLMGHENEIQLIEGQLAFTLCQVPIVYMISSEPKMVVVLNDGSETIFDTNELTEELTEKLFARSGEIIAIRLNINETQLR